MPTVPHDNPARHAAELLLAVHEGDVAVVQSILAGDDIQGVARELTTLALSFLTTSVQQASGDDRTVSDILRVLLASGMTELPGAGES